MTAKRPPWLGIAVLQQLFGDHEPLVGDLVEEYPHRSRAWFWRQVMFAVLARAITGVSATVRNPEALAGVLSQIAIFGILSFQVAVAGSLLTDLLRRVDNARLTRLDRPEWLILVALLSLPAAWAFGRAMSRLHRRSRVATVFACGASAAIVGSAIVSVSSSEATGFFSPSAAHQTAAAMVFVLGFLVAVPAPLPTIPRG